MEGAHSLIDRVFRRTRGTGFDHLGGKADLFVIRRDGIAATPFSFHGSGYLIQLQSLSEPQELPVRTDVSYGRTSAPSDRVIRPSVSWGWIQNRSAVSRPEVAARAVA